MVAEPAPSAPSASGARVVGGIIGLALLLLFFLGFWQLAPHNLWSIGYEWGAATMALAIAPTAIVLGLLAAAPARLQSVLSRFTRLDLRDGAHVAALVVITLTLFYVVGFQTANGVLAVEQVYGPPGTADPPPPTAPRAGTPSAVVLNATLTDDGVVLNWSLPDRNATSIQRYRIYRGLEAGHETFLANATGARNHTDDTVGIGVPYTYVVTAVNAVGEGAPSNRATVIVPIPESLIIGAIVENLIVLVLPVTFYVAMVHGHGLLGAFRALGMRGEGAIKAVLIGVGVTILFLFVMNAILLGVQQVQELPDNERAQAIGLGVGVLGALIIAVGSSVSEEVFYRGFLQPRVGVIGQAVIFAIAHVSYVDVIEVVVVFLLAFLFAFLYKWTKSLWAPIAAHFAFNLINLLAIVCTADPSACTIGG